MIGESISHYRITDTLGAGGMGEVYRAYDTQLERMVALKILPANLVSNEERIRRFMREAKAASAISHPNVAHIYEIGEANGLHFIAMELIEGQTLARKLSDGFFSPEEIVAIASAISDALQEAHAKGIVHRDIKPANIMITPRGQLKLLDFGLAKIEFQTDAATYVSTITQTEIGTVMGTLPYMSPEQLRGEKVDQRTDFFSLGVVLYQLATGKLPFEGKTSIELADSILHANFPSAHKLNNSIPPKLSQVISKMLAKNPQARYQTASEILAELGQLQTAKAPVFGKRSWQWPRWALIGTAVLVAALVAAFAFRSVQQESRIRWARDEALPQIMQLVDQAKYSEAVALASTAEKHIPNDAMLKRLWPNMSVNVSINTDPPAADVYMKPYEAVDADWKFAGKTPVSQIRIPKNYFRWKIEKSGFTTVYRVAPKVFFETKVDLLVKLDSQKNTPQGMVKIPAGDMEAYLPTIGDIKLGEYWIDSYEVTNEEYKRFVDSGGYQKKEYWKHPLIKEGRTLTWEEAMTHFHDSTGRPGPMQWEVGTYPEGQSDYAVTGVSWYEAAAYAEFVGKTLPTIYHWFRAAGIPMGVSIIPLSNVGTRGVNRSRGQNSMSPFGTYDMAGNVKEWCWNETVEGQRFILGGAYNEALYLFQETDQRPPFARHGTFGFRCVKYGSLSTIPAVAFEHLTPKLRDYAKERPVSDEAFPILKGLYSYTPKDLAEKLEAVNEERYWRKEKVTFNAAYANERIIAHVFLPKNTAPPYQTVVFFPGAWAQVVQSSEDIETHIDYRDYLDFVVRAGRAAVYPVYKGTFERGDGSQMRSATVDERREWTFQFIKDVRRTVDYLQTRKDIDQKKIAYYGYSWGARVGSIVGAVEPRFAVMILAHGGLPHHERPPEADELNFVSRVKLPVLMINGRYDHIFPVESSQKPFFQMLGTRNQDKAYLLFDGGHNAPRNDVIRAVLDWLDRYLGKV